MATSALEKLKKSKAAPEATTAVKKVTKKIVSNKSDSEPVAAPAKRKLNMSALTGPKPDAKAIKTAKTAAPEKTSKVTKTAKAPAENEVPAIAQLRPMKEGALNDLHSDMEEDDQIEGWNEMDVDEKREAMIVALHGIQEDEDGEGEETGTEEDDDADGEEDDTDAELTAAPAKKGKVKASAKGKKGQSNSNDLIVVMAGEIENMTEEQADAEFLALSENIDQNYFKIGGILAVIKENKFFGEYETFRQKVEAEFNMKYRKADYLIDIYNNVIESGLPWEKLKGIGWSKLNEISHLINEDNIDDWLEKAEGMNVASLRDEVKAQTAKGSKNPSTKAVANTTKTMTFKVHEDQQETIDEAIEKAMSAAGVETKTQGLEIICMEYLAAGTKKAVTKDMTVKEFFKKALKTAEGKNSDAKVENALQTILEGPEFKEVFGIEISELDFAQAAD